MVMFKNHCMINTRYSYVYANQYCYILLTKINTRASFFLRCIPAIGSNVHQPASCRRPFWSTLSPPSWSSVFTLYLKEMQMRNLRERKMQSCLCLFCLLSLQRMKEKTPFYTLLNSSFLLDHKIAHGLMSCPLPTSLQNRLTKLQNTK